ncbi:MAG: Methyltransferase [Rhodospirillales bacterium]|nr:Methyltransferase [Rhodospirillales bacterium]
MPRAAFGALARLVAIAALALSLASPAVEAAADDLDALVAGPQRSAANRVRDPYRHPAETLAFFGVRPDMTIVEIWPGGSGWWTEILAPYLRDAGKYYAAGQETSLTSEEAVWNRETFAKKMAVDPALYGKVVVTEFAGDRHDIAPPGSADMIVTFRNVHNWMADGSADATFRAFYKALKPGGILGIEEHRGDPNRSQDPLAKSGYVREDWTIALAEKAGFKLAGKSEVNANPKDTKDYAAGVWTLPPSYRLKDQDRAKYEAIGESDRFTMRFVKPGG